MYHNTCMHTGRLGVGVSNFLINLHSNIHSLIFSQKMYVVSYSRYFFWTFVCTWKLLNTNRSECLDLYPTHYDIHRDPMFYRKVSDADTLFCALKFFCWTTSADLETLVPQYIVLKIFLISFYFRWHPQSSQHLANIVCHGIIYSNMSFSSEKMLFSHEVACHAELHTSECYFLFYVHSSIQISNTDRGFQTQRSEIIAFLYFMNPFI